MKDSVAREKLRSLDKQRNTYHNSRRDRCERHESFCKTINEMDKGAVKANEKN